MAIERYDPLIPPETAEWSALGELAQTKLVADYHVLAGLDAPNPRAHAMMHVVVENQISLGVDTPTRERARQLMAQGLDRHETIHAIASVLIRHIHEQLRGGGSTGDPKARYHAALKRLNAKKWRRSG